ncbi:MarC family NAAT transporter [Mycetohabitans sp. B46]|uniref:MarC family NAAT transporter n=1 Tax=Mycetohabitans sp. B46 TaxID=2772536 RepID=UPI00307F2C78
MNDYLSYVGIGLITLLPIINPITSASVFFGLSAHMSPAQRKQQINLTALYVLIALLVCFYAGSAIMNVFGISVPGMRVAGGMIVTYIGFGMLFPKYHETETQKKIASTPPANVAFIPLTLPVTVGPGAIAMIVSDASAIHRTGGYRLIDHLVVLTVDIALTLILWLTLRSASRVLHLLGRSGTDAISRVMGFMLVCMGVQFGLNGLHGAFIASD